MISENALLSKLNDQQRQAVLTVDGPVLVLAGAGSGKTRVIIHRIALLLSRGVPAHRILAVTFTNKAANEMKERIVSMVGKELAGDLRISTFHAFGLWIVRRSRQHLGVTGSTTIIDETDRNTLLHQVQSEMGVTERDLTISEIQEFLMQVKGCGADPRDQGGHSGARKRGLLLSFLDQYTRRLRLAESLDFDDLILLPVKLLEHNLQVRTDYQRLFDYLMVDEYQDTNYLQFRLIKSLLRDPWNICVVGDDDQSIYGWRGARVENILDFDKEFPGAKVVKLTRNYRSEKNILQLANSLIARNQRRRQKELWTESADEVPVRRLRYESQEEEARDIAERIMEFLQGGKQAGDLAVLYRTKGQSRLLQEQFRLAGIPYRVVGSFDFFERKEVRDILAYLRLVCNPHDQTAFRRVVNTPARGIGLTTLERLENFRTGTRSAFNAAKAMLASEGGKLQPRTRGALQDFLDLLTRHHNQTRPKEGVALIKSFDSLMMECGLRDDFVNRGESAQKILIMVRAMLLRGLENGRFRTLPQFLERITLDEREADHNPDQEDPEQVTLMTVHASKGLEFDAVFIVGLVEGLFPHSRSVLEEEGLEEERRLFYVALTRARRHLVLSTFRRRNDRGEVRPARPSRFIRELPAELLHSGKGESKKYMPKESLLAAFDEFEKNL
jgi:DNA helicase II / ATP-dependent DNA helicase PcrA